MQSKHRSAAIVAATDQKLGVLRHPKLQQMVPWLAGAGMAMGHAAVSSNCTVPQQGRCSSCGSCIVVVGSLVFWALAKQRRGVAFYEQETRS